MNSKEYIASGILELYVAGSLSEKENEEVSVAIQQNLDLQTEVASIEKAIVQLTAFTKKDSSYSFDTIKKQLELKDTKVISLQKEKSNWKLYTGWAASLVLGTTLVLSVLNTTSLKDQLASNSLEKDLLKAKIDSTANTLTNTKKLLAILRDKEVISVTLNGQSVAPEAYTKVYWNQSEKAIYLDAKGLPDPPKRKVYQVWSLKLNPLTPKSLGTLDSFTADTNKIFTIKNANNSEAFGITLEPEGGSITPTLEQLYTLGAVS